MFRVEYPDGTRLGTFDTLEEAKDAITTEMTKHGAVRFKEKVTADGVQIHGSAGNEFFEFLIREVT